MIPERPRPILSDKSMGATDRQEPAAEKVRLFSVAKIKELFGKIAQAVTGKPTPSLTTRRKRRDETDRGFRMSATLIFPRMPSRIAQAGPERLAWIPPPSQSIAENPGPVNELAQADFGPGLMTPGEFYEYCEAAGDLALFFMVYPPSGPSARDTLDWMSPDYQDAAEGFDEHYEPPPDFSFPQP